MKLAGLQKTTLIDFPGIIACSVFTLGCNFRCPFCHNKQLVDPSFFSELKIISLGDFFSFLAKRKNILDGVCITGGEPTLHKDLVSFISRIKDLGFKIKLDTNGSNPVAVSKLIKNNLVDFFALDFKTSWENYPKLTGFKNTEKIKESIRLILKAKKKLQIRTTLVPKIHNQKVLLAMAKELKEFEGKFTWKWQDFRPRNTLEPRFSKLKSYSGKEIKELTFACQKIIPVG
ncbi:MAG: anaerobic ribonucleoside-triphosphate reductase activating protein [Candidatus Shapirobacteria bacterium]